MKQTLFLVPWMGVALPLSIIAGIPSYEPFADSTVNGGSAYGVGEFVPGQSTGSGGVTWSAAGPAGATNSIAAGGLSVPGLSSSSGGSMQFGVITGPSARMNLGTTVTSGTLFYSFALKVTDLGSLGTSGGFVVGFNNSSGNQAGTPTVVQTCLMMRAVSGDPGGFNLGVRKVSGTPSWSSTAFHLDDVIFVVGSYQFNSGSTTDDIASLWLNPDSSTFGLPDVPSTTLTHTGVNDIASPGIASLVFFRRGDANLTLEPATLFADEIRVGMSWAEVTPPVPEPSSFALVAGGLLALSVVRRSVR